jgi:hypothetical protein
MAMKHMESGRSVDPNGIERYTALCGALLGRLDEGTTGYMVRAWASPETVAKWVTCPECLAGFRG